MKRRKIPPRVVLTLMLAALVFCIQAITVALVMGVYYLLAQTGVLYTLPDGRTWGGAVLASFALISVLVATALSLLVGRGPVKWLNTLIEGLEALAAGEYQTRISIGNYRNLENKFNLLAEELENTQLLRTDFINDFSHEFKTPLVSILGFARLLKRGNLPPEQSREYIEIIEEEALRLSAMATNVLDVNRFENQRILTDVTRFNLSEQLRTCVLLLEKKWSAKELEFTAEFAEHQICANQDLLKQVWINLLDNAVKFSPPGGRVELGVKAQGDSLLVTISNQGDPIPEKDRDRIFRKFYQCDRSHATQGNGLGLSIAKRVVELHRGRIWVDCPEGTVCFHVELPSAPPADGG
ncbi:MAG: HAMP domain-containing histidine kinase [Oscillospiraceae bacterium]|nr:HAMP domain-containing histidine kinase [Oscillospiraceae bacterium]